MLSRFNVGKFMKEKKEIREKQAAAQESIAEEKLAVYKSGTGTRGRGRGDTCVGTWDLRTSSMGRGDDNDY